MRIPSAARTGRRWVGAAVLFGMAFLGACGGSDPVAPDPAVAPFVGDWAATVLQLTSLANPEVQEDPLAFGATFSLNVQPSGQYTAILLFAGQDATEIGRIEVSGSTLIQYRDFPSAGTFTATYAFQGPDRFVLDGDTEYDFNHDGTNEAARAHMEFVRK